MEWALWGLDYLAKARIAIHSEFNAAMEELRGQPNANRYDWFHTCKNVIFSLYHFSIEFVEDTKIPSGRFASPDVFETALTSYRAFLQSMSDDLNRADQSYRAANKVDKPPYLVSIARHQVASVTAGIDYVQSKHPHASAANPVEADLDLILELARRFHEAVLSLKDPPHKGMPLTINDEWDCQYLFRAILAAYIPDVRVEEWNPSVAWIIDAMRVFPKNPVRIGRAEVRAQAHGRKEN